MSGQAPEAVTAARWSAHETARAERLFLAESYLARTMAATFQGALSVGFALALGADTFYIGVISAAPFFGGFGQLLTNPLIQVVGSRRRAALVGLGLVRVLRVGLVLLPLLLAAGVSSQRVLQLLVGLLIVSFAAGNIGEIARLSWMSEVIEERRRGDFFARRNLGMGLAGIAVALSASRFIDWWRATQPEPLTGFQVLLSAAVVFGLGSWVLVLLNREPPSAGEAERLSLVQTLAVPFQNGAFRWLIAYRCAWSFSVGFAAGFFNLFMLKTLKMSYSWCAVADMVGGVCSLYCVRFWGRLTDRFGNRPVLAFTSLGKGIFPLLWLLLGPRWWPAIFAVMMVRALNSGQMLTETNLALKLSPDENRAAYLSVYRAAGNLARALSPILAGSLAAGLGDRVWHVGPFALGALHLLFAVSAVLRLVSVLTLLRRIPESDSRSLSHTLRVMSHLDAWHPTRDFQGFLSFWLAPVYDVTRKVAEGGRQLRETVRRADRTQD